MASRKHVARAAAAALVLGGAAVVGLMVAREPVTHETPDIVQSADTLDHRAMVDFVAGLPRIKQSADALDHWLAVAPGMRYGSADAAEHWIAGG
jgi:hypothetical protein